MNFANMQDQPSLIIINGTFFFSKEEQKDIKEELGKAKIKLFLLEQRGIQNSIFSGIEIILNNSLLNLFIGGIIMPTLYEYLKKVIQITINKVQEGKVRQVTLKGATIPNVILKIPTKKGEIIASIDKNLSEKELDLYLEALVKAANSIDNNENYNAIYRVIDKNSDGSLLILTLNEYLKRHHKIM
ncbi:hypothetical protein [Sporolactobacillus laevolacticus]|uniref:hypothetical protein n=1 Tax=Sporolactobacillus laevolacticus TaxID=33018 RepID=UPI0025B43CE8|nr:hypothetical protein [Sporolactobacillus laevolacticus]MDN3955819.1 hypothetical protein [Sporolactobacillus laevolacticus]